MSDPLMAFLLEQFAEDERVVRAATPGRWTAGPYVGLDYYAERGMAQVDGPANADEDETERAFSTADAEHIALFDPQRMLAEVEAKREILALHTGAHECSNVEDNCTWIPDGVVCDTARFMTIPYVDRPGYDPAWGEA